MLTNYCIIALPTNEIKTDYPKGPGYINKHYCWREWPYSVHFNGSFTCNVCISGQFHVEMSYVHFMPLVYMFSDGVCKRLPMKTVFT